MIRVSTAILTVCIMFFGITPIMTFASEPTNETTKTPNNVTITVVMPDKEPEPTPESTPTPTPPAQIKIYPVDVSEKTEGNRRQIVKTYELSPLDNPADIPRDDFERNGWMYSLTDILKRETANAETRDHKETVTLNTDTKELEKILTLLAPTMEYKTDDEFVGILSLDVASIKVATAGTKTTSFEMKVTREYPHLSANDTSLVPKTVTEKGKTYNLAGVDWKAGNYETVDYEQVPEYYTAIATYTATGSSTKVTGYVTTAEYVGTLAKLSEGKTVYTAFFEGSEIRTPLEMTDTPKSDETTDTTEQTVEEPTPEPSEQPVTEATDKPTDVTAEGNTPKSNESNNNSNKELYVIIGFLASMVVCGGFYIIKNRKENNPNEKTIDATINTCNDSDDSDTRSGSGL